jgi:hypothetical protein
MEREFEIIKVIIHHNRGLAIFAKHLGSNHNFSIADGSKLRDMPIYHYTDMYPIHDADGNQKPDIFVFRPFDMENLFNHSFKEGDRVTLFTSE